MAKFVVLTTFASQDLRAQHRPAHRDHLKMLVDQGALTLAGPFEDEASGGLMVFEAESAEAVKAMVDADPFATEGVFATITIRPFTQVAP
jgi:uncharacterized protein YciI